MKKKWISWGLAAFVFIGAASLAIAGKLENERYIRALGAEFASKNETPVFENGEDDRININTADVKELDSLTGIGKGKAERIIEYRSRNGNFKAVEDIMKVTGIGRKTFDKFKNDIKVG